MPRLRYAHAALVLLSVGAVVLSSGQGEAQEKEKPPAKKKVSPKKEAEAKIRAALDRSIELDFKNTPLREVADSLKRTTGINVVLDQQELNAEGKSGDTPVTRKLSGISLRSALKLMLNDLGLTWTVRDEALVITTYGSYEAELKTRVYPIGDLVAGAEKEGKKKYYFPDAVENLIETITGAVASETWEDAGGSGTIASFRQSLVVRNTQEVHEEIERLLTALQKARSIAENPDVSFPTALWCATKEVSPFWKTMAQPTEFNFVDTPLKEVAEYFGKKHKINIVLHVAELEAVGKSPETSVTIRLKGVSLGAGLSHLLRQMELTWILKDEVLQITTRDFSETQLTNVVFPVADLVGGLPKRNEQVENKDKGKDVKKPSEIEVAYDTLIDLIVATIIPDMWHEAGGQGSIAVVPQVGALVITQTAEGQRQIEQLLVALRDVQQQYEKNSQSTTVRSLQGNNWREKLNKAWDKKGDFDYLKTPLKDVVNHLSVQHNVPMLLHHNELEALGIDVEMPITAAVDNITLRSALRHMLRPLKLRTIAFDEVLLITSADFAETQLEMKIYGVGDLLQQADGEKRKDRDKLAAELYDVLESGVAPDSWENKGGACSMKIWIRAEAIVIDQYGENHRDIQRLLTELRKASVKK